MANATSKQVSSTAVAISGRRAPRFELIAGEVCLDFINTLDDRFTSEPKENLSRYGDLARFAEDARILEPRRAQELIERGYQDADAARVLAPAIRMREAMYSVIWAVVNKKPAPATALAVLNGFIQESAQHANLVEQNGKFAWQFDNVSGFAAPLWPIARSAADLLASERMKFVRPCASRTCMWLFLDESKNHRRRWCDMTKCGNRAKFQRFYDRTRSDRQRIKRARRGTKNSSKEIGAKK
jgi:predicted RNA-binding Zn ribbon-like protein